MTLATKTERRRLDPLSFVEQQVAKRAGSAVTLVLALPAPDARPARLLEFDRAEQGFSWHDDQGSVWCGLGVAERLDADGVDRFERVRQQAAALGARIEIASHPEVSDVRGPRFFGGAAFSPGGASSKAWSDYGDCSFVLPRWTLESCRSTSRESVLWLAIDCEPLSAGAGSLLQELLRLLDWLEQPAGENASNGELESFGEATGAALAEEPSEHWIRQVEDIRSAIRSGEMAKVVAARRVDLGVGERVDPAPLFSALEQIQAGCTGFLFRRGHSVFLGATPERLVRLDGRRVSTHALAGSIEPSGQSGRSAEELLASRKDQLEHRLVVEHLVERLRPLCEAFHWSDTPVVRRLRDVLHLETPMEGHLSQDLEVLELVAAIHPTPAVGGLPVAEAVRWIVEREEHPRGWYSGPVGWFDLEGNGDFVVALRSVLVDGEQERAYAYVGAGIVAESDPVAEFEETEVKLRALRSAISATAPSRRTAERAAATAQGS